MATDPVVFAERQDRRFEHAAALRSEPDGSLPRWPARSIDRLTGRCSGAKLVDAAVSGREGQAEHSPRRVLIVANRTTATPTLLDHVKRLARERPPVFSLLIPDAPKSEHTDWTMELALPLPGGLGWRSGRGAYRQQDPYEAVRRAVADGAYDEIVISTLPTRASKWPRRDLPRRVAGLGLPVTVVTPDKERLRDQVTAAPGVHGGIG